MKNNLKILFLSAEIAPLAKVGGLGDVAGALPKALSNLGVDIRLVMPFYGLIDIKKYRPKKIGKLSFSFGGKKETASLWQAVLPQSKILVYLIKHASFSSKEIYSGPRILLKGKYTRGFDDVKRFALFTRASLVAAKFLNFVPDIIQANDWHAALVADFLKTDLIQNKFFEKAKTLFTIHNLANQGLAGLDIVSYAKINPNLPAIKIDAQNGDINFMVQGIINSDLVNTVSPTYAREITTKEYGAGLEKIIKKNRKKIFGILNGVDTNFYNPAKDKLIVKKFSLKNISIKTANKLALQKELGLPQNKDIALAGLISRFVWQKGLSLFNEDFTKLNCQFVFLGTGEDKYEKMLRRLAEKYPDKIKVILKFDEALAHRIYAASDIFLMPSLFEPCGLGQMIAMRYGAVPVVRDTGGLKDTINNFQFLIYNFQKNSKPQTCLAGRQVPNNKHNGFSFKKIDTKEFYKTLKKALDIYYNQSKIWRQLQTNGMVGDYSWNKSAKEYLKLYNKLISNF